MDRDRHLQSQPSSEGAYTKEPWNNSSKGRMNVASQLKNVVCDVIRAEHLMKYLFSWILSGLKLHKNQ